MVPGLRVPQEDSQDQQPAGLHERSPFVLLEEELIPEETHARKHEHEPEQAGRKEDVRPDVLPRLFGFAFHSPRCEKFWHEMSGCRPRSEAAHYSNMQPSFEHRKKVEAKAKVEVCLSTQDSALSPASFGLGLDDGEGGLLGGREIDLAAAILCTQEEAGVAEGIDEA